MAQTHTSVPCPFCGKPLFGGAKACPACGWSSLTQPPSPLGASSSGPAPAFRPCPSCGSEAVQRVPAVVGGGTWTSYGVTAGSYGGHDSGGGDFSGSFVAPSFGGGSTDLAKRLAPPRDPNRVYSGWFFAGLACLGYGVALALMAGQVFGSQPPEMVAGLGTASVLLLALCGLCVWRFALQQAQLAQEKARHPERMRRWAALYYCGRCDTIYDPASGKAASAHDLGSLLG